jgi:2-C-methyl-D-erythritol 4-phosphate cytidylyltransferase / 2-C-methyl-D-erythritol 2,4-cyclodiphosphate synthase
MGDQSNRRIGFGNDVHRLAPGRKLILGGVSIPFEKGPAGHSDGDALAHAICDALLGAAALGDIGHHFPDNDPQWHNASSLLFLHRTRELLDEAGYRIANIDSTISLEHPKLAPYIFSMRNELAEALGIPIDQISVKAKTGEGVDAVGEGTAIRVDSVVLIEPLGLKKSPGSPLGGEVRTA